MALSIVFNSNLRWTANDWVVRQVAATIDIDTMLFDPSSGASESASARLQPLFTESSSASADFSDAGPDEMQALYEAAQMEHRGSRTTRAKEWFEPNAFPEFLEGFNSFMELLSEDPRVQTVGRPTPHAR